MSQHSTKGNYAFVDSQNLNQATQNMGWNMDWVRFRAFLKEKYNVQVAYLFIGYVPENQDLYAFLQKAGYVVLLKPTTQLKDGTVKGNIDADLVLQVMIDYNNYDKAVIVTGDGDFHGLVNYLYSQQKLETLMVPNRRLYSQLLTDAARERLTSLNDQRKRLQYHKRSRRPVAKDKE